jgi:hypothetical protein
MKYGCHSDISPDRCKHDYVDLMQRYQLLSGEENYISKGVRWEFVFTRECHYDKKHSDDRCTGCKHPHELDTQVPQFLEW